LRITSNRLLHQLRDDMTIFDALRHQWARRWRSDTRGRSFLATTLLALLGGYSGLLFLGLGGVVWTRDPFVQQLDRHRHAVMEGFRENEPI